MVCEEEYEILDQIGRGSYGKVYRAQHDSGEVHAIKVIFCKRRTLGQHFVSNSSRILDAQVPVQLRTISGVHVMSTPSFSLEVAKEKETSRDL